jgi:dimethylhistidine N-methyltransferase
MQPHQGIARREIIEHLSRPQASVSPKYLYDRLGCRLFEAITCLPEYYPTRIEQDLLERHGKEIAALVGSGTALVDLGAGNGEKARSLFAQLNPRQYVAVDFSADFVRGCCARIQDAFPHIEVLAVGADLTRDFALPAVVQPRPRLFFYPGSSIGNFDPEDALTLLSRICGECGGDGGLLIGVDLIKERTRLEAAYDDVLGLTAAFNRNVLAHINALIGSDFQIHRWRHRALFNAERSRVEMHLEAVEDHCISWPGGHRPFAAGERIHTESSYKYRLEDFIALLRRAGFPRVRHWTDANQWYVVCHAGF